MDTFSIGGKTVSVFPAAEPGAPLIVLNTFSGEGQQVLEAVEAGGCPPFSLVAIRDLDWNCDMAPWDCPPAFRRGQPCTGGADNYLQLLTGTILPAAEQLLPGVPRWRAIAGYSLAGLFALYALFRTGVFSRAASMSGSLWFPGFQGYVLSHAPKRRPDCVYFSLGERESKTRNPTLQSVRRDTEALCAHCQSLGIPTVFRLHPGNHYDHAVERTAAGILWLLRQP